MKPRVVRREAVTQTVEASEIVNRKIETIMHQKLALSKDQWNDKYIAREIVRKTEKAELINISNERLKTSLKNSYPGSLQKK